MILMGINKKFYIGLAKRIFSYSLCFPSFFSYRTVDRDGGDLCKKQILD